MSWTPAALLANLALGACVSTGCACEGAAAWTTAAALALLTLAVSGSAGCASPAGCSALTGEAAGLRISGPAVKLRGMAVSELPLLLPAHRYATTARSSRGDSASSRGVQATRSGEQATSRSGCSAASRATFMTALGSAPDRSVARNLALSCWACLLAFGGGTLLLARAMGSIPFLAALHDELADALKDLSTLKTAVLASARHHTPTRRRWRLLMAAARAQAQPPSPGRTRNTASRSVLVPASSGQATRRTTQRTTVLAQPPVPAGHSSEAEAARQPAALSAQLAAATQRLAEAAAEVVRLAHLCLAEGGDAPALSAPAAAAALAALGSLRQVQGPAKVRRVVAGAPARALGTWR